jgi:hypothetical protein
MFSKLNEAESSVSSVLNKDVANVDSVANTCSGIPHISQLVSLYVYFISASAELAVDAMATLLEHKTKYFLLESQSWIAWDLLFVCLRESCSVFGPDALTVERKIMCRCIALVFQRLSRGSEKWNFAMIMCVENLLELIQTKHLCGLSSPNSQSNSSMNIEGSVREKQSNEDANLLLIDHDDVRIDSSNDNKSTSGHLRTRPSQTKEEEQLLFFMFDVVSSIRRSILEKSKTEKIVKLPFENMEAKINELCLDTALSCLTLASELCADRIANEVIIFFNYDLQINAIASPKMTYCHRMSCKFPYLLIA